MRRLLAHQMIAAGIGGFARPWSPITTLARNFAAIFAALALLGAGFGAPALATDLASMSQADIRALQERLTDARCYSGPIDGRASAAVTAGLKTCPVMDPILSIETGMHTAPINRVGPDRDCKLLASGSDDKTLRLWSVPDGRLIRTMRPPIGPGLGGKIYALAMSPDGRLIAVGGLDAHHDVDNISSVYLFDAASGDLKARISSFETIILDLVFSPDGRYLATLGDGLSVIDVAQMKVIATDQSYGGASFRGSFAPDGRLFTIAYDQYLRAYDSSFRLVNKAKTSSPYPYGVSVDPGGKLVAVGYRDSKAVDVYRTSDLGLQYSADLSRLSNTGDFRTVTWSSDGSRLVGGGRYWDHGNPVAVWNPPGPGRAPAVKPTANSTILSILPCGSGFAFGSVDPMFGLLDVNGRLNLRKASVAPDTRNLSNGFRISADGAQVRFGLEPFGKRPVLFDVMRATLDTAGERPDLNPPRTTGLNVTDWEDTNVPKLNGKPLPLDDLETSRSLAIASDRKRLVLGAEYSLRAFDAQGKQLWNHQAPGVTWSTNLTADGRLIVAAYGDGTIRWHRLSDGQELLALFVNTADQRWVAWTPSGYYMASPGGEDMIGWTLNRGWDQAADFFPASRFHDRFSRPDVVQQVLVTLDEGRAVEAANHAANISTDTSSVTSKLPPVIKILSPADGSTVRDGNVTVEYDLRSPSGLPVDSVEVLIDGHPIRGFTRSDSNANRLTVNMPSHDAELGLLARSGLLASEVAKVRLHWGGQAEAASGDPQFKPKLYGVVVGVSNYANPALKLKYPAKDALDVAKALQAQKDGLYRDVELKVLTDADATSAAVKRALSWLEKSVTSRDVGIVFLAGHGQTDAKNRYFYLTVDTDLNELEDTALEGVTLRDRTHLASKVLVFLDTCYAGQAMATRGVTDISSIVNELSSTQNGVITYASSTGREVSMEDPAWGNGAFTKALIEGLAAARADLRGKGVITTAALDYWISERVKELTHGAQHPVMIRPSTVPDFPMFMTK